MIINSAIDLIGNTPVIKYKNIYLKLEYLNSSGSIKDRPAKWMIEGLEKDGLLKPGDVIVEPTSGNTGISLAMIGAVKGYKVVLVMPESMSLERRQVISAYGAEIVLTDAAEGMAGSIKEAERLVKEQGYVMPSQFTNYYNVISHIESTAIEIVNDFEKLDVLVCGIGTGGTISGLSKALKEKFPNLKVVGVEPEESPVISKGEKGAHGIQGIGAGFIPSILDLSLVDEVRTVSSFDAIMQTKATAKEGLLLGISSGAAIKAGLDISNELRNNETILVIAPDGGLKYLSTGIFDD